MKPSASRPVALVPALALTALLPLTACTVTEPVASPWITQAVAVADLNADLVPDIVSVTALWDELGPVAVPGYVSVRLQAGAPRGTFADPIRTDTCLDPVAIAVGDVDGDGRPDLAVACGLSTSGLFEVAVHLQSAARPGWFAAPTLLSTGTSRPTAVRLADLDGDGRLDVVVGSDNGSGVQVFFQQHAPAAAGTFAAAVTFATRASAVGVAVGALTGAGRLDLVAVSAGGRVEVLLHDVTPGTFLPGVSYPAGLYPVAVEIADLDGDGNPDLLIADSSGALLVMTQTAGAGHFDPVVAHDTFDWDSRALVVADLDGDGRLDVAVASAGPAGLPGSVAVFLQAHAPAAPGTLLKPAMYAGYWGPLSIAASDIDGNTLTDLVIADGRASIRYQGPTHVFAPPVWLRR